MKNAWKPEARASKELPLELEKILGRYKKVEDLTELVSSGYEKAIKAVTEVVEKMYPADRCKDNVWMGQAIGHHLAECLGAWYSFIERDRFRNIENHSSLSKLLWNSMVRDIDDPMADLYQTQDPYTATGIVETVAFLTRATGTYENLNPAIKKRSSEAHVKQIAATMLLLADLLLTKGLEIEDPLELQANKEKLLEQAKQQLSEAALMVLKEKFGLTPDKA